MKRVVTVTSSQEIPLILETDLLVVGGGLAGLAAAAEVAQSGRRVALVESETFLGYEFGAWQRPWIWWQGARRDLLCSWLPVEEGAEVFYTGDIARAKEVSLLELTLRRPCGISAGDVPSLISRLIRAGLKLISYRCASHRHNRSADFAGLNAPYPLSNTRGICNLLRATHLLNVLHCPLFFWRELSNALTTVTHVGPGGLANGPGE